MHSRLILLVLALVVAPIVPARAAGRRGIPADPDTAARVTTVVTRHFKAMRNGDCRRMQRDLTETLFQAQHSVLCEQNRDYRRFLRENHEGTTVRVDEILQQDDGSIVCTITLLRGGDGMDRVQLRLDPAGHTWKISQILS